MSINDPNSGSHANLPAVTETSRGSLAALPAVGMPWSETPASEEGLNLGRFFHSLRRHWLLSLITGFVAAASLSGVLHLVIPLNYDAQALIRVRRENKDIFSRSQVRYDDLRDYETFKKTQAALIKSTFVVQSALRKEEIAQLPMLQAEDDPVSWLADELRVSNPEDSEILSVSLRGENTKDIKKIVDAVIDSYETEVVQAERDNDLERLRILKNSYRENVSDVKELQDTIATLSKEVGSLSSESVEVVHQIQMDQLMRTKSRRDKVLIELQDVRTNLVVLQQRRERGSYAPSEHEIEDALEMDPFYAEAKSRLLSLKNEHRAQNARGNVAAIRQLQPAMQQAYSEVEQLKSELYERVVDRIRRMSSRDPATEKDLVDMLETERILLSQQFQSLADQHQRQEKEIGESIGFSADLEIRKAELETLTHMMEITRTEMDSLDLELKKRPRIQVIQRAVVPEVSDWVFKYGIIFVLFTTALGSTVFGIAYWDYQLMKVNVSGDVPGGTNVRVVGSLPALDRRGRWLLPWGGLSGSSLEAVLIESIDSVRTAILCGNGDHPLHVVMVTSAIAQEGKTTLAGQLAISLARSGRRTLLVDADVHNPQQHHVFSVPFGRGFCELLRGEATLDQVVQHVSVEGLSMITAGYCNQASLRALTTESVQNVFSQLRSEFDFIVVDSGPVLVGADPLLLGQHADTTLLSLCRDISRIPKINEAHDRLQAVGVNIMGAVLNGVAVEVRRSKMELVYDEDANSESGTV
ncbi:MAG: hypothetical protein CMJ81_16855 [Planctomycetaceae bacterium]|nr:hypothetical protein [Planctomycetaceae bacterium]